MSIEQVIGNLASNVDKITVSIGFAGLALGFYLGKIRSGRDYDKVVAERDASDTRLDRLCDVLEGLLGVKVAK